MSKILVTGGAGFVGRELVNSLILLGYGVIMTLRDGSGDLVPKAKQIIGDLIELSDEDSDSIFQKEVRQSLRSAEVVIHLAARVHVMDDDVADPLTEFRKVNTQAVLQLAQQAAKAGVKRFVFLSSIKVNGEMTVPHQPFTEKGIFIPDDPYGLSKHEAEQGLLAIAKDTNMEVVIIRPPLVYGPGVRANFASMVKWIQKGIPLPFGAISNKRSLVGLVNLVDFIVLCADREKSPKAANEIFLISDNEDVSTSELLRKVASAFGKKSWLIPVPVFLMTWAANLISKGDVANRLFGSLQVDSSKARDLLGWKPVITMDAQLKKIADAELNEKTV